MNAPCAFAPALALRLPSFVAKAATLTQLTLHAAVPAGQLPPQSAVTYRCTHPPREQLYTAPSYIQKNRF